MEDVKKLAQELTVFCMLQTHRLQANLDTPIGKTVFSIILGLVLFTTEDADVERCIGGGSNCWEMD